ncbi:MAG: hypothetical protein ACI81T_004330 [Bacteroidia bacterium]
MNLWFNRVEFGAKSIQIGKQLPKIDGVRLATWNQDLMASFGNIGFFSSMGNLRNPIKKMVV